jgi:[protein-PII] uridylyltransferase
VPANNVIAPPKILWFEGTAPREYVVQIRSSDRAGLLARLTAVIEGSGLDIVWAKVTTLGSSVVDAFGLVVPVLMASDTDVDRDAARRDLERDLLAVLPAPAPAKQVSAAS